MAIEKDKNSITLTIAKWCAAQGIVAMAKNAGIKVTLADVLNKETSKEITFLSILLLKQIEIASKKPIKIIFDT